MTDLIACISSGKGTWGHVARIIDGQEWNNIFLITNDFGKDKLVYGELLDKTFAVRKQYTYTILEDHNSGTKLRYEVHFEPIPVISWLIIPVFRRIVIYQLGKLFLQLKEFSESTDL